MTEISPTHPRYASLRVRARLAEALRRGLVVPEGLIAQGRGEAFDYFLGERTTASARRAESAAAVWLLAARHPVVSVNGNVAALAADAIARLARARPGLRVEVNLFHRTSQRAARIARVLRQAGVARVLGVRPTAVLPGLASDRALVDANGIASADVCLVPLEDGDRADALARRGTKVISIDLNPLSRTNRTADLPIVDELTRALEGIRRAIARAPAFAPGVFPPFAAGAALDDAIAAMDANLRRSGRPARRRRASRPPPRGSGRPMRRTR
ncbi:MAG: phosphopantothenate/pantothenate synthetase [Thermoplasmata archaeon]